VETPDRAKSSIHVETEPRPTHEKPWEALKIVINALGGKNP